MSSTELQAIRGKDIAMIFQEPMTALNPLYTVGNQIMEAVQCHNPLWSKVECHDRSVALLQKPAYPIHQNDFLFTLISYQAANVREP